MVESKDLSLTPPLGHDSLLVVIENVRYLLNGSKHSFSLKIYIPFCKTLQLMVYFAKPIRGSGWGAMISE